MTTHHIAEAERELPPCPHPILQDALFCYAAGEDGTHAVLVRGWPALYQKLRDDAGIEATDDALIDLDEWSMDGEGAPFSFGLNFEGDWVAVYRICEPNQGDTRRGE